MWPAGYNEEMERKSILVQYTDGSLQWLKNTSEEEVAKNPEVARVKSQCYGTIQMESRRWRTGVSEFHVEFLDELPA
ncbi:hypothetical protein EBT16_00875 [bacterium]|nr:hypothetical protein [bacterium]